MKELPSHIEEKVGEIVQNKVVTDLERARKLIDSLKNCEGLTVAEIADTVKEANRSIDFCSGDDNEMYDDFRFRMFRDSKNTVRIVQGHEVDVDPRDYGNIQQQ